MSSVKTSGPAAEALLEREALPVEASRFYTAEDIHILVLDDDPAIGRLVQATFAGYEFNIDVVSDPALAFPGQAATSHPILDRVRDGSVLLDARAIDESSRSDSHEHPPRPLY